MTSTVLAFSPTNDVAAPLLQGITNGCVYGLIALGIVLIYTGNRFFNFAQAEFGTVAAIVAGFFREGQSFYPRLPYPVACFLGVAAAVLVAVLTERLVVRPLFRAPRITLVVATTGIALLLIALESITVGSKSPFFTKLSTSFFKSGTFDFTIRNLITFVALAGVGVFLVLFFRTRYGTAVLAVSQEPTAASLAGINVSVISLLTWGIAGLAGGVAGVIYASNTSIIGPSVLTTQGPLIAGFVAAVLGGMTSLPGAFVGGLSLGVIQSAVASPAIASYFSAVPGFRSVVIFIVLLVVLLVRPKGLLGKEV